MNYFHPYYPYMISASRPSILRSLFSNFNFSSILTNTSKTLNIVNQAIPIVKQARPMIQNAKTMFQVMNEFKKEEVKETKKEEPTKSTIGPTFFL